MGSSHRRLEMSDCLTFPSCTDFPRFSHRAILLDSSRHFQPLSIIRDMIDAMAAVKLNVLHWHLVDEVSFPFNSTAAPYLSMGAWSYHETYSADDLRGIVAYARDRGVRIMAEIDTPGHSFSWSYGYPGVITDCPNAVARYGPAEAVMDPSNVGLHDCLSITR